MLHTYRIEHHALREVTHDVALAAPDALVWIDLNFPTPEEEKSVERLLGVNIPTREEMQELELSNRFYQENGAVFATATIMAKADTPEPEAHPITFVLMPKHLITIRYSNPYAFRVAGSRAANTITGSNNALMMLATLLEAVINRTADVLEDTGHKIDDVSRTIFRPSLKSARARARARPNYEWVLREIGIYDDIVSKLRESMVSITRLLGYVMGTPLAKPGTPAHERLLMVQKDIPPLNDHASFLSNKISFLLDAALGMMTMDQNATIKIFSVAAVVFLPPTLIASVYGMNFHHMPELDWQLGYPLALGLMMLSAYLPFRYFKHRNWL